MKWLVSSNVTDVLDECVRTQQALDSLAALAGAGAREEARGEARGGGGRAGRGGTAAGGAGRTAGSGDAASLILQNRRAADFIIKSLQNICKKSFL